MNAHEQLAQQTTQDVDLSAPSQNYEYSLALIAHAGGDKRIVALLNNNTLVKEVLAKAFVELEENKSSQQSAEPVSNVTKIEARKQITQQTAHKEAA